MRIHGHLFHMDHSSNWKMESMFQTLEFVPIRFSKDIKRDNPLPAKVLCFHYYLKGCSPQPIMQLFYHCSKSLWPSPPCLKHLGPIFYALLKARKCLLQQNRQNDNNDLDLWKLWEKNCKIAILVDQVHKDFTDSPHPLFLFCFEQSQKTVILVAKGIPNTEPDFSDGNLLCLKKLRNCATNLNI